jgi:hypothetical protein
MEGADALKQLPQYKALKEKLGNPEWRLDNLYYIRDEQGRKVKFTRNEAQADFYQRMAPRNVLPKARKLGFSTLIDILILDRCMFRSGNLAGIVDRTMDDAKDKLSTIRFAYDNMPEELRRANPLVQANQEYLEWQNGSSVGVGVTYRGGTPSDLHISEYGKVSVDNPDQAREIKTGTIQAVPATGRVWVESTAHGTDGEFAAMVKAAQRKVGKDIPAIEYKFHFYGWWIKPEYRVPNHLVVVTAETKKYLDGIEKQIGRKLDADQRAWYQSKLTELGPDDIKEEFPSTADELFYISKEGTFWREEIARARREGRIGGLPVPHDPTRAVNTWWDIGQDMTAIWFHQGDGVRHRFIDYWEMEGASLQHAARIVREKKEERGFIYGKHLGPHDLDHGDWANSGKTRAETAEGLGVKFTIVPRVEDKDDAIEAGRRILNTSFFDHEHCSVGEQRLENYAKRWNKTLGQWTGEPLHDINCHGADAYMTGAMGDKPEKPKEKSDKRHGRDKPKRSHWSN